MPRKVSKTAKPPVLATKPPARQSTAAKRPGSGILCAMCHEQVPRAEYVAHVQTHGIDVNEKLD